MEIEVDWTLGETLKVTDPLTVGAMPVCGRVSCGDRWRQAPSASRAVPPLFAVRRGGAVLDVAMQRRDSGNKFDLTSDHYKLVRHVGRGWPLPEPARFYGFPDEATAYYQNTAFLSDLVLELERMLKSVFYVGPLREYPKRLYQWSGETPDHVGTRGDRAIEAILAAGGRVFNWRLGQRTRSLAELVAERLRSMRLIRDFEVKQLGEHRKDTKSWSAPGRSSRRSSSRTSDSASARFFL